MNRLFRGARLFGFCFHDFWGQLNWIYSHFFKLMLSMYWSGAYAPLMLIWQIYLINEIACFKRLQWSLLKLMGMQGCPMHLPLRWVICKGCGLVTERSQIEISDVPTPLCSLYLLSKYRPLLAEYIWPAFPPACDANIPLEFCHGIERFYKFFIGGKAEVAYLHTGADMCEASLKTPQNINTGQ